MKQQTVNMGGTSSTKTGRKRQRNKLPPRIGRDVVPISQLAKALRWSTARVRGVDDILKPIRLADGTHTRLYHVDRALAFIKIFDEALVWSAEHETRVHRKETRRNLAQIKRAVNAVDPLALVRIGAPADVYANEVREIATWLPYCRTEHQVQRRLRRLFVRRYTCKVPNTEYAKLAKMLYRTPITVTIFGGRA